MAIVGAGAAGLATAIFARRFNRTRSVVLLDGARSPGAKILVSGGSRCNVTNAIVTEKDFWGGKPSLIRRALRAFPVEDTVAFFRDIGVTLHEEPGGKLFPDTNRARDVLAALLRESDRVGATLLAAHRVIDVVPTSHFFRITTDRGEMTASAVVLATGGQALPKSGSDGAGFAIARRLGHRIVPPTPALAPLLLDPGEAMHAAVSGVSHDAELAVWIDGAVSIRLSGSLLWTHFGISGPVALNASRHWLRAQLEGRRVAMTVSFRPGARFEDGDADWQRRAASHPKASVQATLATMLPASVAAALLRLLALDGTATLAHFLTRRSAHLVARSGRTAATRHRLARLHVRGSNRRRRRARRDRRRHAGVAHLPGPVVRRRDPRRRRPHRRLQLPVGVVERIRRRPRACGALTAAPPGSYAHQ